MSSVLVQPTLQVSVQRWDGFLFNPVDPQWPRLNAHRAAWINAIEKGFGHEVWQVKAEADGAVVGVLPLVLVTGPIFGKFLVSLPYVNTGGVWASSRQASESMITAACELADRLDVKYLELRHEQPIAHAMLNFERRDKMHMRLALPESAGELKAALKSKVRNQVKRSQQFGSTVQFGQHELLNDFYRVFAANMRDLGTPVFSRKLFAWILDSFNGDAEICLVQNDGRSVAAALLVHCGGVTEVPSASCLRAYNATNANMFMYWNLLNRAIAKESVLFDFGRSSKDSGTFRFKAQWGSTPVQAVWQYYVRQGNPADMQSNAGGKQRLVKIWQHLPVWVTRLAGPYIVKGIP